MDSAFSSPRFLALRRVWPDPLAGPLRVGSVLVLAVEFDGPVRLASRQELPLNLGGSPAVARYLTGDGSRRLLFTYTIRSGDAVSLLDLVAGSSLNLQGQLSPLLLPTASQPGSLSQTAPPLPDLSMPPQLVGVRSSSSNRTYRVGDVLDIRLQFSEAVLVRGAPTLALALQGGVAQARLIGGSGSRELRFSYVVRPGDRAQDLALLAQQPLQLNGGSLFGLASRRLYQDSAVVPDSLTEALGLQTTIVVDGRLQVDPRLQDLTFWNRLLLDGVAAEKIPPQLVARALALLNTAFYDVVNVVQGSTYAGYAIQADPNVWTRADLSVAMVRAAGLVLADVFQGRAYAATVLKTAEQFLARALPTAAARRGDALGREAAEALLALRGGDRNLLGSSTYTPPAAGTAEAGAYLPTGAVFPLPASLPDWGGADPWITGSINQATPGLNPLIPGLPEITSSAYAEALAQVKQLGSSTSSTRTPEQAQIAEFWANGAGTETPPGHWQAVLATIAEQQQLNLLATVRLYAAAGMALADAGIAAWDVKYDPAFWRPITAIQQADRDGNPATEGDPSWQPLISTPPFPAFPSGHSTFSAAAATVAGQLLGDAHTFTLTGGNKREITRSYTSLMQAAEESGLSRIYGGIHFSFDNVTGLAMGQAIGLHVLDQALMEQAWLPDGGASYQHGDAGATARSVQGGSGDDLIIGSLNQGNRLWGNAGNDVLIGGTKNDWLVGGTGVDQLIGRGGSDVLIAGSGGSRLVGSDGYAVAEVDRLVGGEGADRFVLTGRKGGLVYSDSLSYAWIQGFDLSKDSVELLPNPTSASDLTYRLGDAPLALTTGSTTDSWLYRGQDAIARFEGISLLQWGFNNGSGGMISDSLHRDAFQWA